MAIRRFAPLVMTLTSACSAQVGACGEAFCLPVEAKITAKAAPVDDFNLIDVEWNGEKFRLYEGDFPQTLRMQGHKVELPLDQNAALNRIDGYDKYAAIGVHVQDVWPRYVEVNGPCPSSKERPALSLAASLSHR